MCKTVRRAFLLVSAITSTAIASEAIAAQRTFVSGAGSDANPCSLSQPCGSLGAAIELVSAGGEVVVLDSAGYGPVTISQSVSITAPGVYAGITSSGGSGISISGSNLHVTLRGLTVNSLGGTDAVDVFTDNSEVRIERCTMHGFAHEGLRMAGVNLHVHANNGSFGVRPYASPAETQQLTVEDSAISDNGSSGIQGGGAGCTVTAGRNTIVRNSVGLDNSGATFTSFQNNELSSNTTTTLGTIGVAPFN